MGGLDIEHDLTIWMTDDIPAGMYYAGRRWRVSDTPTRLRDSIWSLSADRGASMYGWRFQATDEDGHAYVFDVFKTEQGWHFHRAYE